MSYRFNGKQKTLALGVYPDISLKAAREARGKARTLLAQGIDPNEQKKSKRDEAERQQKEEARTFEFVAREWFDKKTRNLSPAYRKQKLQRVENHLFPYIGRTPMATLDLPEIVAALDHLRFYFKNRGKEKRALRFYSKLLNFISIPKEIFL